MSECFVTKEGISWNVTSSYMGGGGSGVEVNW